MYFDEAVSYALEKLKKCSSLQLRPEQVDAVKHLYGGKDAFVWLPTGFGKSICYQVLPFMFDCRKRKGASTEVANGSSPCLVLVISPLIALMIDQVRSLRRKDVRAASSGAGSGVDQPYSKHST
jgi:superfamily II DNA helicase RecQ